MAHRPEAEAREAAVVTCIPERSKVCLEGSSQPFFHILRIETAASKDERPQLCVSVVVDASGSMAGQKLLNAKRGVRKLIKHLGPHDVLNCVAYDSDASTVFNNGDLSPEGKPELVNLVRQLKTGGATNLHAGLERGVELLRDSPTGSVRRVFLFSDGCVNAGVTDHGEILAAVDRYHELDSVTVSTFGIGRDFDESLMVNIARRGKGTFEFLDRPEDITAQVSKSVHGLLNIAGLAATLTVGGLSGCSVLSVGAETGEEDRQAEDNTLNLGDLHSANTRQVLVKLELPGQSRGCDWLNMMEYRLTFIPPNGSEPVVIAGVVSVLYAPASAAKRKCNVSNISYILQSLSHNLLAAANGSIKTVAVWTMVDEHGQVEIRDWSGATYQDIDYVDKTVRIRRVRITSTPNTNHKIAEFLPGCNGTKYMVAPRLQMMRWWLGDK